MRISSKKLNRIASKWAKMSVLKRRKLIISLPGMSNAGGVDESHVAEKGHFVVYTTDQKRHVVPLSYLSNNIFIELLKMSEEEFGLSSHSPITLPCDSSLFENIVSTVEQRLDRHRHLEKALLCFTSPSQAGRQALVCGN